MRNKGSLTQMWGGNLQPLVLQGAMTDNKVKKFRVSREDEMKALERNRSRARAVMNPSEQKKKTPKHYDVFRKDKVVRTGLNISRLKRSSILEIAQRDLEDKSDGPQQSIMYFCPRRYHMPKRSNIPRPRRQGDNHRECNIDSRASPHLMGRKSRTLEERNTGQSFASTSTTRPSSSA